MANSTSQICVAREAPSLLNNRVPRTMKATEERSHAFFVSLNFVTSWEARVPPPKNHGEVMVASGACSLEISFERLEISILEE